MSVKKFSPKKIKDQVVVLTNATSTIGIKTAFAAMEKGAKVVLGVQNPNLVDSVKRDLFNQSYSGHVIHVDLSVPKDLYQLSEEAMKKFGRIDTWINNPCFTLFGPILDRDLSDEKKLFEHHFWSPRLASELAVEEMKEKGGVLINLGLELTIRTQPLFGVYSASKEALKVLTRSLRLELKSKKMPIEVCLLHPILMDVPYDEMEKNCLIQDPLCTSLFQQHMQTAKSIIQCAEHPVPEIYVGKSPRVFKVLETFFPEFNDLISEYRMKESKEEGQILTASDLSLLRLVKSFKNSIHPKSAHRS